MIKDKSEHLQENAFGLFYSQLEKDSRVLRLFERNNGEYYSCHGHTALLVAESLYKTNSVLKYWSKLHIPSCTLSKLNAIQFIHQILAQSYKLEIWNCQNRSNSWNLYKSASPGNITQIEYLIHSEESNGTGNNTSTSVILSLKVNCKGNDRMIGIAYTDATCNTKISVAEFLDNDIYANLEALLIQTSVKECILPKESGNLEIDKIKALLDRCEIIYTECEKTIYSLDSLEQDMNRLLNEKYNGIVNLPEYNLKEAMGCVASLVHYLSLMTDSCNFGQYELSVFNLKEFMRLDASAVKALNIMPSPQDGSNKTKSLYGVLNKCQTSQGSRLLAQWLKQPLMNLKGIEKRLDLTEFFIQNTLIRQDVRDHLKKFPDLHRIGKRFLREKANLQDVIRVYQVVICLCPLMDSLKEEESLLIQSEYLDDLNSFYAHLQKFIELVETTVDLEAADRHEYKIKYTFSPDLGELQEKMNGIQSEILTCARKVARNLDFEFEKKLKYEVNAQYGHYLRLSRNDASKLRGSREYIELATQKAGVLFTTHEIKNHCESIQELQESFDKLQKDVVKEVVSITCSYLPILEQLNHTIAHLDVITSFAEASLCAPIPYVRPTLSDENGNVIQLKASRHPCVELQENVEFIPNDAHFERDSCEFQLITGPNMGGKSTFIRQVGVVLLMAQVGCFVPCQEAKLSLVDSILARVGASDSQLKGISTFMAEMLETSCILKSATAHSFVIIDELGRGTSTSDGFGLAYAISEFLASQTHCWTFFATHFHELTDLQDQIPTVKNLHVTALAQDQSMTLLYKVRPGICDQSFGIHVAEMAKFPNSVVNLAKRKAAQLEESSVQDVSMNQYDLHSMQSFFSKLKNWELIDFMNPIACQSIIKECL